MNINYTGSSTADYLVTTAGIVDTIKLFKVEDLSEFSDHCQLTSNLDCYYTDTDVVNLQLNDGVHKIKLQCMTIYNICKSFRK